MTADASDRLEELWAMPAAFRAIASVVELFERRPDLLDIAVVALDEGGGLTVDLSTPRVPMMVEIDAAGVMRIPDEEAPADGEPVYRGNVVELFPKR